MIATDTDRHYHAVAHLLADCKGKSRAMTLATIADHVGTSRREVEATIEHNLSRFPFVIVSCSKGLFIPTGEDDLNRYLVSLHKRHHRMQLREETTKHKARLHGFCEQGERFIKQAKATQQDFFV